MHTHTSLSMAPWNILTLFPNPLFLVFALFLTLLFLLLLIALLIRLLIHPCPQWRTWGAARAVPDKKIVSQEFLLTVGPNWWVHSSSGVTTAPHLFLSVLWGLGLCTCWRIYKCENREVEEWHLPVVEISNELDSQGNKYHTCFSAALSDII